MRQRAAANVTPLPVMLAKRPRGRPPGARNKLKPAQPVPVIAPVSMRIPEAARHVGVSPSLMKKWVSEGRVTSVLIGGVRLIHVASLNALLAA
jgi:hypothetical protein